MPAHCLDPRRLGSSGLEVSGLSLGSWRTYERLPAETGVAILRAAREEGITFFDDARYNDETGRAPLPTGYSEVVFGNLFRAAGLRRDDVVVANILSNPLVLLAPLISARVRVGGRVALSGILETQIFEVIGAYAPAIVLSASRREGGWVLLEGERR